MGSSSGLLCLGIVLLWAFAAVPHWVVRREQQVSSMAAEVEAHELRLLARRADREDHARSGARLLGRPSEPVAAPASAGSTRAARPAAPQERLVAPASRPALGGVLALGVVAALVLAGPAVLAALAGAPLVLGLAGPLAAGASMALLRTRARSRARAAATERALAAGRARVREAQARAGARRTAAELAAEAGARAAAREAALARSQRSSVRARAVGE